VAGVLVAAACLVGRAPVAQAQDPIHKIGRGVVNVLTGWIELPKQMHLGSQQENPVTGVGRGLLKGAGLTVLRGGVGVYEAVTFPIPYPKDFASPYESMELRDYAWE
jgi:putative exosortase-associated protein (TIGR04073 family)